MSMHLAFRQYSAADFEACLRVFRSNMPQYFAESELPEFASFLQSPEGEYLVAELGGTVAACGGSYLREGVGRLCWGMVDQSQHGSSIGSALLARRLNLLFCHATDVPEVGIDTSQLSSGFFERFGFRTQRVTPDGFANGIDCVAMVLRREDWLASALSLRAGQRQ